MPRDDATDFDAFHQRVLEDLRLATSTFMTEDPRSAQHLLAAKRQLNAMERATGRRHLARLEAREPGGLEASTLHLTMLRDLRRVNSHLSSIGYDVLGLVDTQESSEEPSLDGVERVPHDPQPLE